VGNSINEAINSTLGQAPSTTISDHKGDVCFKCGSPLISGAKFCMECGEKVAMVPEGMVQCSGCGAMVVRGKFCPECGNKLV